MALESRETLLYRGGVLGAGAAIILAVAPTLPQAQWSTPFTIGLLLWAVLITLAEASPVPLPRSGAHLTFTPAFDLSAIFLFGPGLAVLLGCLSRYAASLLGRRALRSATLSAAQAAIVTGVAGLTFLACGGRVRMHFPGSSDGFLPLGVALVTYALMRALLVSIEGALLDGRGALTFWQGDFKWELLHDLLLLPFAPVLAWVQLKSGAPGAAYALIPVLVARYAYRVWDDTRRTHLATVRALMSTIDAFDPFTRGHSYRISRYALRLARHFNLPERKCEEIEYGALLHDIGRTAIHLDILQSPRTLDAHERATLQTHPTIGYEIVRGLPFLQGAAEIVYAHHEQPDGKGYPRGLSGEAIPMGARFITVAAAFDAMTQDRPYRRGLAPEVAYEELRRHSGTQFFPEVVGAFIQLHRRGELGRELNAHEMRLYGQPKEAQGVERSAA